MYTQLGLVEKKKDKTSMNGNPYDEFLIHPLDYSYSDLVFTSTLGNAPHIADVITRENSFSEDVAALFLLVVVLTFLNCRFLNPFT